MSPLRIRYALLSTVMMNKENFLTAAVAPLLAWYGENRRELPWRKNTDPYRVWVSEIMLQQTRVAAVIPYYERWMEALPDIYALANVDEERLMKLWQGLGYYSRARNLQKAARMIVSEYGGRFPDTYDELRKLPGVGEYTAGAVASIAFSRKVGAVDGNVLRIAARVGNIHEDILDQRIKKTLQLMVDDVVPKERSGDFNQALMDLGATVCLPNGKPLCEVCPLADLCKAREMGTEQELPIRSKKSRRRVEKLTVFLLVRDGAAALRKRGEDGLLSGLWEFPNVLGTLDEDGAASELSRWGLTALDWKQKITAKHIFTHVEWHMTGYLVAVKGDGAEEFVWVDREHLDSFAVPGAFQKYLRVCAEVLGKL